MTTVANPVVSAPVLVAPVVAPIDPLRSCAGGHYDDGLVTVVREVGPGPALTVDRGAYGGVRVAHRFGPAEVDDEIGTLLATALMRWTRDHEIFARAFTGIVLTTDTYAPNAWRRFYRNTLALLQAADEDAEPAGYAGVYQHALDLLPTTSVVDLGCSFGFLACHLAARGTTVTACDIDPGSTALLRCMARHLRQRIDVRDDVTDIADASSDAVALLHVLEHVDADTGAVLLAEAQRIARRRVVVAVPLESEPEPLFGHVRRFDLEALRTLGAATGWTSSVHERLGGWLVLDRPTPGTQ